MYTLYNSSLLCGKCALYKYGALCPIQTWHSYSHQETKAIALAKHGMHFLRLTCSSKVEPDWKDVLCCMSLQLDAATGADQESFITTSIRNSIANINRAAQNL